VSICSSTFSYSRSIRPLRMARVIRPAHTAFFSATGGSPLFTLRDMTIQRMDNVAIVVEDLPPLRSSASSA
jgi:hypothetical protein